jgi:hypothetical protein
MDGGKVGVKPLPLPEDTKTRLLVKEQIMNIKGLTKEERTALVLAYEERAAAS